VQSAPVDGSGPARALSAPLNGSGLIFRIAVSPDSNTALWTVDRPAQRYSLYVAPSTAARRRSG